MERSRLLDLDGLDGILQSADKSQSKAIGLKTIWAILIVCLILIMLFFLQKQADSPAISPMSPAQPTENTFVGSANTAPETMSVTPSNNGAQGIPAPIGVTAPVLAMPVKSEVPESTADPAKIQQASATQSPPTPVLPVEPTAAGNPDKPKGSTPLFTLYFKLAASKPIRLSAAETGHLIDLAKSCPKRVRITGHTCNLGTDDGNQRLGQARAFAVKKMLIANGIAAQQIDIVSEGMSKPVASNDTSTGQASNRRAELNCLDQ